MADANLLEILDKESKLDNMIIYGNIRYAINKPSFLSDSIEVIDGFFALVDVLALRCNGVDYFSENSDCLDSNHIYFSKGSVVIVITDRSLIGKNVKIYGRTTKGCTIKKQRTNNPRNGIVAFAWTKSNGNWCIVPNKVLQFGENDARGTILEDYIVSLVNGYSFKHPNSVNSIAEYYGANDAEPLSSDKIVGGMEYSTELIDLSKISLNLIHRLKATLKSEFTEAVGDAVYSLKNKSKEYSNEIVSYIKGKIEEESRDDFIGDRDLESVAESIVHSFVSGIAGRYNFPLSNRTKTKGKEIIDEFLDNLSTVSFRHVNEEEDVSNKENSSSAKDLFKEVESLKKVVALSPESLLPDKVSIPVLKDYILYATLIIGHVTGIGMEDIVNNHNTSGIYNGLDTIEWFWCLIRNPYLCGLLGSSMGILDCDRVFCGFSEGVDEEEYTKYRDMLIMLDKIKNASSRSTLIKKNSLLSPVDDYPSRGKRYLEDNGAPYSKDCLTAVCIIKEDIIEVDKDSVGLSNSPKTVLKDLNDLGLIEEVNDGVILTSDLYKEYVIYSKLIEKGMTKTGVDDSDIEETIYRFEKMRGFNLEQLQKDGINLIKYQAGVLSGCAGSGKTTTSDCMVEGIKSYLPDYELRFGAPTGKAARRLAEVVGGGVKTIHSMFGLGLSSAPYITKKDKFTRKSDEGVVYAYILDEMAMCNTNLMYEIVNHLNDDDLVYFLGDIKQLSPIGKGSPFRSLMHFLPCIELGVSKRAAENGKINYNCGLINFVSDDYIVELHEGDDFLIKPCSDASIQLETVNSFKSMLSVFEEDDIQVVTGYQTDKYPWSTVQLNPLLQNLLRKPTDLLYVYNEQKFMRNDRVIHVKRNAYDMPRYRMKGNSVFEEVVTFGIVNGELGKIVGYIKSTDCTIFKWSEEDYSKEEINSMDTELKALIEKRKNTSVDIRDESFIKDENLYFVVVQVYDVDLKENVYVLYHANFKEDVSTDYYSKTFVGGDLKYLDLAYALTTHKMQGSQSPCIIIPLGSSSSSKFMNRNMINTMITRASDKVILIGSVSGKNSALTNGRRVTNIDEGEDVLGLLAE